MFTHTRKVESMLERATTSPCNDWILRVFCFSLFFVCSVVHSFFGAKCEIRKWKKALRIESLLSCQFRFQTSDTSTSLQFNLPTNTLNARRPLSQLKFIFCSFDWRSAQFSLDRSIAIFTYTTLKMWTIFTIRRRRWNAKTGLAVVI